MSKNKCPICDKPGLEDYRKKEIKCPSCDSDLGVFTGLQQITSKTNNYNLVIIILIGVSILTIFLGVMFNNTKKELKNGLTQNMEFSKTVASNENTIKGLKHLVDSISQVKVVETNIAGSFYVVKSGDSFCKISTSLFNSEARAQEIAKLNGIDINSKIFAGTKLIIPTKK